MFKHDYMDINSDGHLVVGGCDTVELADTYGTPLYVMDEGRIRSNMKQYTKAIESFYGGKGRCLYASKAFSCKYMYKLALEEGFRAVNSILLLRRDLTLPKSFFTVTTKAPGSLNLL